MKTTNTRFDASRQKDPKFGSGSWVRGLACLAVVIAIPVALGVSQVQQNGGLANPIHDPSGLPPISPLANRHPDANRILEDSMRTQENLKHLAELNAVRQKQMADDTAKLVALAHEVKTDLDKSSKETVSMIDVRKIDSIEKLARSVREKMKSTAGD